MVEHVDRQILVYDRAAVERLDGREISVVTDLTASVYEVRIPHAMLSGRPDPVRTPILLGLREWERNGQAPRELGLPRCSSYRAKRDHARRAE
ncbi:hypothetical protein [Jiangella alkaliphila]|uniref:hypothetical protein n=1 Tax=Jiangella alkaliphila TaxID=419479 RepID=UPI00128D9ADD|nr:hypothetical protein [Jiangella alkaliphila]